MAKARLMMDFDSVEAMYKFYSDLQTAGMLDPKYVIWESNGVDFQPRKGGVGRKHSYVLALDDENKVGRKLKLVTKMELAFEA